MLPNTNNELLKLNDKKKTWFKKWANDLNIHLTKEYIEMENKQVKRCLILYIIRDCKLKLDAIVFALEWWKFKTAKTPNAYKDVNERNSFTANDTAKLYSYFGI